MKPALPLPAQPAWPASYKVKVAILNAPGSKNNHFLLHTKNAHAPLESPYVSRERTTLDLPSHLSLRLVRVPTGRQGYITIFYQNQKKIFQLDVSAKMVVLS